MTGTAFDAGERRSWTGRAEAYAASFARLCVYPASALLDAAGVGPGCQVLDVGTGSGTVAVAAVALGADVTAVDAQPDMVALTARTVPTATVRVAALPHLPFADGAFDVVVLNFVLNHVGSPRTALAELRRVTRPGGRIALTIWSAPAAAGAALLGRAVDVAGAGRPAHLPPLPAAEDFVRDEAGFAGLLTAAGLRQVECRTLAWDHQVSAEDWWSGPAAGVTYVGQVLENEPPVTVARIREHYDRFSAEFLAPDGLLHLPHAALLAVGVV